jgi:hypothetical protein
MFKIRILFLLMICLSLSAVPAKGQEMEIGVFGGGSYYLGELNPGKQLYFTRPAFGGIARINYDTRWAIRLSAFTGQVAGDDAVSGANVNRNLRFQSSVTEISTQVEFNFFDYFTGSKLNYFTPYLFAGPGFFIYNPKVNYNGEMVSLVNLRTEGQTKNYSLYGLAATFGFGFKYSINSRLGLGFEWGMRKTNTDYLDDVSTVYYLDFENLSAADIDAAEFLSDPSPIKHKPDMQRGNPENNDWYAIVGATLTYRFTIGEKSTCSDFEYSKNK